MAGAAVRSSKVRSFVLQNYCLKLVHAVNISHATPPAARQVSKASNAQRQFARTN